MRTASPSVVCSVPSGRVVVFDSGSRSALSASVTRRAATAHDTYTAHQAVEHDDMNVLCLGARVIGANLAREIVDAFLKAQFSGDERHLRRLAKIHDFESRFSGKV